jgi:hypothetical protein
MNNHEIEIHALRYLRAAHLVFLNHLSICKWIMQIITDVKISYKKQISKHYMYLEALPRYETSDSCNKDLSMLPYFLIALVITDFQFNVGAQKDD